MSDAFDVLAPATTACGEDDAPGFCGEMPIGAPAWAVADDVGERHESDEQLPPGIVFIATIEMPATTETIAAPLIAQRRLLLMMPSPASAAGSGGGGSPATASTGG